MVSFEEAFEQTGYGIFNHVVVLTCGLALLYTNVESLGVGFIITAAQCDLSLSSVEEGMVNASAFIGIVATALIWGYLSDKYGRRSVILPAIVLSSAISLASSFAVNFWNLFLLRFFTGCLMSASSATVYAYLGEMHPDSHRAAAIAFGSVFISFTFICLPILAWIIMPGTWTFKMGVDMVPWRIFIWSWCTPGLLCVALLFFLPESPRYLFAMKGQEAAIAALAKIYAWNNKKNPSEYPIQSITMLPTSKTEIGLMQALRNIALLCKPPLLRCTLITHFSMFMVFSISSGLYTWMPIILDALLYNINLSVNMCDVMIGTTKKTDSLVYRSTMCRKKKAHHLLFPLSIVMGIICACTFISIGISMRKFNKVYIYCTALITCSLCIAISSVIPVLWLAAFLFMTGLASGCVAGVLAAMTIDVFPTRLRALALCTMYMAGRLGAAFGANLLGLCIKNCCLSALLGNALTVTGSTALMFFWPDPHTVRSKMQEKGFSY